MPWEGRPGPETCQQLRLPLKSRFQEPRAHWWGVRGKRRQGRRKSQRLARSSGTVPRPPVRARAPPLSHGEKPKPRACPGLRALLCRQHTSRVTHSVTEMLCVRSQCVTLNETG